MARKTYIKVDGFAAYEAGLTGSALPCGDSFRSDADYNFYLRMWRMGQAAAQERH